MPTKKKLKQPFKAKTMGSAQREIKGSLARRDSRKAMENTSPVTVFRPDEAGELATVETLDPVVRPVATRQSAHETSKRK